MSGQESESWCMYSMWHIACISGCQRHFITAKFTSYNAIITCAFSFFCSIEYMYWKCTRPKKTIMMDNDNNLYIQPFITVQNMKTFLDSCHSCCVMHVCTNLPLGHGYGARLLALKGRLGHWFLSSGLSQFCVVFSNWKKYVQSNFFFGILAFGLEDWLDWSLL